MPEKALLGRRIRRLRTDIGLTQAEMAERLDISPSYLALIERNQRPLTVTVLLRLVERFDVDLQNFAETDDGQRLAELREVFSDPLFANSETDERDLGDLARGAPQLATGITRLYRAYKESRADFTSLAERVADRDKLQLMQGTHFPVEEVRDFFHEADNHFPEIEALADAIWAENLMELGRMQSRLTDYLAERHGIGVKRLPIDAMGATMRRFDPHRRRILLSEMLPPSGVAFQLATQVALLEHGELLDRILARQTFSGEEAHKLARIGLANYFAGALMMPYEAFVTAAEDTRYDIEVLERRFTASFEQICHRLTTLQKPGRKSIPFFLIRADKAGNISKRFSAKAVQFARFGGACPRWVVYDAFQQPGVMQTQCGALTDGTMYFSIARTVTNPGGGHKRPAQQFALALGCEASHAEKMIYAEGIDVSNPENAVPIGVNCRLCERLDCNQRAFPPLHHRLSLDENTRSLSPYHFTKKG